MWQSYIWSWCVFHVTSFSWQLATLAWTWLPSASWLFRSEQIDSGKSKSTRHTWNFKSWFKNSGCPPCPSRGWSLWCCGGRWRKTSGLLATQDLQGPSTPDGNRSKYLVVRTPKENEPIRHDELTLRLSILGSPGKSVSPSPSGIQLAIALVISHS